MVSEHTISVSLRFSATGELIEVLPDVETDQELEILMKELEPLINHYAITLEGTEA
jgi:hypothetical protein